MNETMRESLSALMDDEANELEIERVLARIGDDEALRLTWVRYHAARGALAGQQTTLVDLDLDVSRAVSAAVSRTERGLAASAGLGQRMLRPLGSFAVAASVAAIVVVGGERAVQLGDPGETEPAVALAARPSPVSTLTHMVGVSVPASFGTTPVSELQPATHAAYQQLARQRKDRYMQLHVEQAALNSPHGLLPYARVPQLRD